MILIYNYKQEEKKIKAKTVEVLNLHQQNWKFKNLEV